MNSLDKAVGTDPYVLAALHTDLKVFHRKVETSSPKLHDGRPNLVQFHRDRLGKHAAIKQDCSGPWGVESNRFWVWVSPPLHVQVSNQLGIRLFVTPEAQPEEVLRAWQKYRDTMRSPTT